jgi:hypothetical protein
MVGKHERLLMAGTHMETKSQHPGGGQGQPALASYKPKKLSLCFFFDL